MGFWDFVASQNIVPTAIGLLSALAISACVSSLTNDVISPLIFYCIGVRDLEKYNVLNMNIVKFVAAVLTMVIMFLIIYGLVKFLGHISPALLVKSPST